MSVGWSRKKIWILILISTSSVISALDRSSLALANTFIAADLHLNLAQMGLVLSSFGWAYLFCNLPCGRLCDRFGVKKVFGLGAAVWSLATASTGLARAIGGLYCSRIMIGVGESTYGPSGNKVLTERFEPSERGTPTGIFLSALRVGFALTPGVMLGLMVAFGSPGHPNWRVAFYLTGFGSLLWVLLWFLTYPEVKFEPGTRQAAQPRVPLSVLLKFRNTWAVVLTKFFQDYLFYLFVTWLPGYLVHARHLDLKSVAFYSTMPWVAGMMAQVLIGIFSDKLIKSGLDPTKVKKTLLISVQVISLAVVFAAYVQSAATAAWLLVLAMAGESAGAVILWQMPQDIAVKGTAGSLGGMMNTAGAMASIAAPAVTGFIAQYFGFEAALIVGGATVVAAALCVVFMLGKLRPLDIDVNAYAKASAH